jgi:hypothetical protein
MWQLIAVVGGLGLLFLLFRPAREALVFDFVLVSLGFWTGFVEARLTPLRRVDSPPTPPLPFRRMLPALFLAAAVTEALIRLTWVAAIAEVLFFCTGGVLGVSLYSLTPSAKRRYAEWVS